MELIWFLLAAFGLTQILVYGKIFDNYRPDKEDFRGWGELFHCPMCMGFWVGLFLFLINGFTELFTFDYNIVNAMICGWVSSASSYVLNMLFGDSGLNLNLGDRNEKHLD
tara:strand:- start:57 stop:386 length:330 start_codon:yes stop_codon:yes gene_type:complete